MDYYNSPHVRPGFVDPVEHHNYHHKHVYDVFKGDKHGTVKLIHDEDDVPTLAEVIEELEEWYYLHLDDLAKL